MCPSQPGESPFGAWVRDEANLPCYELVLPEVPPAFPPLAHPIGNGRIHLVGDRWGRTSLFAGVPDRSVQLSVPSPCVFSAFYLRILTEDDATFVLPMDGLAAEGATLAWGVPYLRYAGQFAHSAGTVSFSVTFTIPRSGQVCSVEVDIRNESDTPFAGRIEAVCELDPGPIGPEGDRSPPEHPFQGDGVIIVPDFREDTGDFFLAGPAEWECAGVGQRLVLRSPLDISTESSIQTRFLFGISRECSFDLVRKQHGSFTLQAVQTDWGEAVMQRRVRAPELWMQQECLWAEGRLLAFLDGRPNPDATDPILNPGGPRFFLGLSPDADLPPGVAGAQIRDMLGIALPLGETAPDQTLAVLDRIMRCQSAAGRIPESLTAEDLPDEPRAATDRSDIEVLFLSAWAWFLSRITTTEVLDQPCPFRDGTSATRWEHIRRACEWVRHELGAGAHGLTRILAGDWNGWLNRVGTAGRGESALNTAMLAWALRTLVGIARRREEHLCAEQWESWRGELADAMALAFDQDRFRRGYTDRGQPVGAAEMGPIFADVQAWAVLARCGTVDQREKALQTALDHCLTPFGIALVAPPPPPPPEFSSRSLSPGLGQNGGTSATVSAWIAWALAVEGRPDRGFRVWEAASIRNRTTGPDAYPPGLVGLTDFLNRMDCPIGPGLPPSISYGRQPFPEAAAFAWRAFAMRRLLRDAGAVPPPSDRPSV